MVRHIFNIKEKPFELLETGKEAETAFEIVTIIAILGV